MKIRLIESDEFVQPNVLGLTREKARACLRTSVVQPEVSSG